MEYLPMLLTFVETKCPKLMPVFLPKGMTEDIVMKKLEGSEKSLKLSTECDLCNNDEGDMTPHVICSYDLKMRKVVVKGVQNVCSICKLCMSVDTMINIIMNANKDDEIVDTIIRHFLLVNGHKPEDRLLMEEIILACYSLKIAINNMMLTSKGYSI